jgi:hypothetical protein
MEIRKNAEAGKTLKIRKFSGKSRRSDNPVSVLIHLTWTSSFFRPAFATGFEKIVVDFTVI